MTTLCADPVFESLDSYLKTFVGDMAARLDVGLEPLFEPRRDRLSEAVKRVGVPGMSPYPAQAVAAEAFLRHARKGGRTAFLVGEMGTGKTSVALWSVKAWMNATKRNPRVVLTVPNQLTRKWQRHARQIIPGAKVRIVTRWTDLRELADRHTWVTKHIRHKDGSVTVQHCKRQVRPEQPEIWILPRDRSKLGYAWAMAVNTRKTPLGSGTFRQFFSYVKCPRCGEVYKDENGHEKQVYELLNTKGKATRKYICNALNGKRKGGRRKGQQIICGEPLWQAFNGQDTKWRDPDVPLPGISPRRFAACTYLRKLGVRFDFYLADEVHELKGESLQGQMFADLCKVSTYRLPMTGTLVGGYAHNLLHLLWRSCHGEMVAAGLEHSSEGFERFSELYGVLETTAKYHAGEGQSQTDLLQGRGRQVRRTSRALPGISPVMFSHFLMNKSVFIRLQEMHEHLPPFDERVHVVRLTKEQDAALFTMQEQYRAYKERTRSGRCWSAARALFLRWPDKPWVDRYQIYDIDDKGHPVLAIDTIQLPKAIYPKEIRIRRLAQRNLLRGRKTWVFTELTGVDGTPAWDYMQHLAEYLCRNGVRATVLRSQAQGGPKPEDREDWIAKQAQLVDVIISNPSLVQTGLDLFDFPSIIYAFTGDNTYRLRQASRRAWRLGQKRECEVDYVVSVGRQSKSLQDAALSLMAQKMEASLAIEGDFSSEGLAAMSNSEDIASKLAKFISGELENLDPAKNSVERYRERFNAVMPDLANKFADPDGPEETASRAEVSGRQEAIEQVQTVLQDGVNPATGRKLTPKQVAALNEDLEQLTTVQSAQVQEISDRWGGAPAAPVQKPVVPPAPPKPKKPARKATVVNESDDVLFDFLKSCGIELDDMLETMK